ncbi:MAG: hypothetical protein AAF623_12935 [Planctomycetota bacterium]
MKKRVLDVGQCDADHYRISKLLGEHFEVEILRAHSHDEAVSLAVEKPCHLVMINRLLDRDGSPAMKILSSLKSDPATQEVPVMIVSNYEDAQTAAVENGAVQGFGKAALNDEATVELLNSYLG